MEEVRDEVQQTAEVATENLLTCPQCATQWPVQAKFCGNCGAIIEAAKEAPADALKILTPTFVYYFLTLIIIAIYKFTEAYGDAFEGLVIVSIIDIAITIAFWIYFRDSFKGLFSLKQIDFKILFSVVLLSVAGAFTVMFIANAIDLALFDDEFYNVPLFEDTFSPLLLATLFVCVQPAIFEEVAFRGFLYSNINNLSSPQATVYVTAFLFGVMHLSFISLLWLVPIGLAFAYLRMKYNTLWYGIVGHFTYNFVITLLEYYTL